MESVLEQSLWEEEIDFKEAVGYGILNAILAGAMGAFDQPGVKRLGGGTSFAEWMTEEEARKYLDFLEKGSTGGLTSEEIEALKKVDELLALKGMDYQDIWEAGKASKGIEGGTRTLNGFDTTVNTGKQGKHIIGNNNYIEGRSVFNGTVDDAQRLVDEFAGTGEWIGTNKERVNFGEVIGQYVNPATNEAVDTTVGIIHYSKTGTHIVPAQPIQ